MIKLVNMVKLRDKSIIGPVDFEINKGELIVVMGSNGSGKSTLLKVLSGIIEPDRGEVCTDGMLKISMMMDEFPFDYSDTIRDICSQLVSMFPYFDANKALVNIKKSKIDLNQKSGNLSLGERKLSHFYISLAMNSDILILDEPTLNVDVEVKKIISKDIQEFMFDSLNSTIVATNNVEDFERIVDRVIYMKCGKILINEDIESLLDRYHLVSVKMLPSGEGVLNEFCENDVRMAIVDKKLHKDVESHRLTLPLLAYYLEKGDTNEIIFK